jgi:flagellar motor switch protein FliM
MPFSEENRPVPELRPAAPILSQDEIDILLGRRCSEGDSGGQTAPRAVSAAEPLSGERSLMAGAAFAHLARLMTTSLQSFTSSEVDVRVDEIAAISFGGYFGSMPLSPLVAMFRFDRFDEPGLVAVDAGLIRSAVDALLAGRSGRTPCQPIVERMVVRRMVEVVLADARQVFAPRQAPRFSLDRIEFDPTLAAMADPFDAAIVAKFRVGLMERGGQLDLVLPSGALAAMPTRPSTNLGAGASLSTRTMACAGA